jgi:hypothetical protein
MASGVFIGFGSVYLHPEIGTMYALCFRRSHLRLAPVNNRAMSSCHVISAIKYSRREINYLITLKQQDTRCILTLVMLLVTI